MKRFSMLALAVMLVVPFVVFAENNPKADEKALELLESYGGPFVIESFNPMSLRLIKKQKPQILRGFLAANYMAEKKHRKPLFLLLQLFLFNSICRPHFISYEHKGYRNFGFLVLRTVFRPVCFCWTVTSKDDEMAAYAHKFDTVIFEGYETENKKNNRVTFFKCLGCFLVSGLLCYYFRSYCCGSGCCSGCYCSDCSYSCSDYYSGCCGSDYSGCYSDFSRYSF